MKVFVDVVDVVVELLVVIVGVVADGVVDKGFVVPIFVVVKQSVDIVLTSIIKEKKIF